MTDSTPPFSAPSATPVGVPLMDPVRVYDEWGPAAEEALLAILRSHAYVKGPHVAALEEEFAVFTGVRHAIAVDSGTDALTLVLRAVLSERADNRREVILPTFTFVATAGAVVNAGGRPVFADVCPDTYDLDPAEVRRHVSERTAAVIPVHIFGSPADMDPIRRAVEPHDVFILEDAAQAIHASLRGRPAGSLADAGTFSFYPSKNLGAAGDGGIVTTDDVDLAHSISALRDHGQNRKLYDHDRVGTNSRMDEIQAAVLRIKLPLVPAWTRERRAIAARYDLAFQGTACWPQKIHVDAESARHLYTARVPERDRIRAALRTRGIGCGVYYPLPLHRQSCFARFAPSACPVADDLAEQVISLPCFPGLAPEEQDAVIAAMRENLDG